MLNHKTVGAFASLGRLVGGAGSSVTFADDEAEDSGPIDEGGGGDRLEIFDPAILADVQAVLEEQAGEMDLLYGVTLDPATDTF